MVVCEASAADCLYRSAVQADGNLVNVTGDLQTIMAGLAMRRGKYHRMGYPEEPCNRLRILPRLDECQGNTYLCKSS